ncbi:TonB-dependent receptor [Chromobacterium sp. IIBBL 290-4]|uniref:TonB-dependent receptor n=1 Tax=Chromobacterium sp. IIBBL 290-4 TaxID=2953890 RepID=UPI0020B88E29|nr:TonB-dependent receptor [Chromobacterium sp. IIBBL 290-4]UTH75818.1 TonB-dependent receptor [Chromobacterium sp. IIBBL 290-4]
MKMKLLAQAIAAIGLLGSAVAHADDNGGDQLERVTITGSNIKSINKEGATPVQIIKKEEIAKTGASTVAQLLDHLTAVSGVTAGTDANSFTPGAASAGLHGMDAKYTLILLNGRRLPTYAQLAGGTDSFTDLNTLPLSVIESVEILRDGASAIYGSDAVAGVINFKTKRNYQGLNSYARYGQTSAGDGMEQSAGISGGVGDLDKDGYNALFSLDTYHREPVFYSKHDATKSRDYRRFGGADNRYQATWGGWTLDDGAPHPFSVMPDCATATVKKPNGNTICPIDYDQVDSQLSPRTTRLGLLSVLTRKLDADSQLYAELGFNQTRTSLSSGNAFINDYELSPGNASYPTDPALLAKLKAINPAFKPGVSSVDVYRSINEGRENTTDAVSNTARAVFGYSTTYKNWDYDASVNFSQNTVTNHNLVVMNTFLDSLTNGNPSGPTYNPFIHGNPASSVTPYEKQQTIEGTSGFQGLELKAAQSNLFSLPGGEAGFAAGVQWWRETLENNPSSDMQNGLIMNQAPQSYFTAARSIFAVYSELNLPVIKNLDVNLAVRNDHYNDLGSTFNPKASFTYRPVKEVLFRGSATSGFKAPSFTQMYLTNTGFNSGPDLAKCAQQGIAAQDCTSESFKLISGGNPHLTPETNKSFSFGMVLQPTKELFASVDFYRINQKNVINSLSLEDVLANPGKYPGAIVRKPSDPGVLGDIDHINLPYDNIGRRVVAGLDIELKYDLSLGEYGKLKFSNEQNRVLTYQDSTQKTDPLREEVDYATMPRWKNVFTTEYSYGKYSVGLTARSYSGFKNLTSAISDPATIGKKSPRIPSYTAWDLDVSAQPLKQLSVSAGVKNLGAKIPPYISNYTDPGVFSGSDTDLWGRTYYVNFNYKF